MSQPLRTVRSLNPSLLAALCLAFVYHGALLLTGTYKRSYDAYVHIFFADHYARSWFDNWDSRWYTGFTVTSYPPGAQQSIALLSKVVGLLDGFVIVQLFAILLVTVGVYRFARLWVDDEAAGYAALVAVFSSSIAETVHVFGQLPTMFSLGFLLNALPWLKRWLERGRWRDLAAALIMFAACTAGHHVTTLFGSIFFAGPVIADVLVTALRRPLPDEGVAKPARVGMRNLRQLAIRRVRRIVPVAARAGLFGIGLPIVLLGVVLPYWLWSASDPITQIPIPHASRDSYIANINAGIVFWLVPWGLCILVLPYAIYKGATTRVWPLSASLGLATFLGTGGTTPFPKLMLGPAYQILTLDRFTFWATILILPFVGEVILSLRRRGLAAFLRLQFGTVIWRAVQVGLAVAFLAMALTVANFTQFRTFQPAAIDMAPIINFLAKDEHWRWRYLTLGFGDQMAWLSAQTTATTVDGNYHSARRLPELTTAPIERLEGAKYSGVPGIGSLQQFLAVPDKYNLKYVFSNDQFYDPLLYFSGWERAGRLENGIVVWQRQDIPPLPETLPRKEIPAYQRAIWGVVPMTAIVSAFVVLTSGLWGPWLLALAGFLGVARLAGLIPGRQSPGRIWRWTDGKLARWSVLPETGTASLPPRWQFWLAWWRRLPRPRPPSRRIRWVNAVLAMLVVLGTTTAAVKVIARPALSPAETVNAYYDALDVRRFGDAYALLDPATRVSYDDYLLDLSVNGGLLASYAKLDAIDTTVVHAESDYAVVEAKLVWVTALRYYDSTQELTLVKRGGSWRLQLPRPAAIQPPDEFVAQPAVDYHALEQPARPPDPLTYASVAERPALQILSARLVVHAGVYSVVGEVINSDVTPADITVTAIVYDAAGEQLTRYNAQTVVMHKLLPKEVTPFRIDFEGVAGTGTGKRESAIEFQPGERFPVSASIWQRAASFQVYANAVTTGVDLQRDITAQAVEVDPGETGATIGGILLNTGAEEAVIPHLLLTYYDQSGAVAWVDEVFIDQSIRSQRTQAFAVQLTTAGNVTMVLDNPGLYANALQQTIAIDPAWADRIPLPAATGFAAVRISINAFVGAAA